MRISLPRPVKLFFYTALIVLSALLLLFTPIEQKPYSEHEFYSAMMQSAESIVNPDTTRSELKAGWAEEPITPSTPVPIASYGIREDLKGVHDTAYVKAFAISNQSTQAYIVTADLLIFPPAVLQALKDTLGKNKVEKIYFSATHTHNGPGGWMEGPAAKFIAGSFNKKYTTQIRDAVITALNQAENTQEKVTIKYGDISVPAFVKNRVTDSGKTDSLLRYVVFEKAAGPKAILSTYGAHANCISHKINEISADYPGDLTDSLEKSGFNMAAFCAGAVGSMGNECNGTKDFDCTSLIGNSLAKEVLNNRNKLESQSKAAITSGILPLKLKDPCPKVYKNWTIRPWAFRTFLGEQKPFISYLKIGNITFIGTPCDYSGELANELYPLEEAEEQNLIFTSFNGNYIGYITPDDYSHYDHSEVKEMNWYGPGSGSYFQEILKRLISRLQ